MAVRETPQRTVVHVVVDRLHLLDLAGPVEVFRTANLLGASPRYRNVVVSPDGAAVRSDSAVTVLPDASFADVLDAPEAARAAAQEAGRAADLHTLVVVGGLGVRDRLGDEAVRDGLVALADRAQRVTSVCTGALLLADAGLLRDRRATTHWASVDELAELSPTTVVEEDPIYVRDGDVWTSAGVTSGIDLALALVEEDHGIDLAHQVAAWLVVFAQRPGGQSQFSARTTARPARRRELRDLQHWMADHLADDLSVPALADRAGMSERTFARAFRDETGTTPAAYVESLRLEAARRLLETTDLTVAGVAREVGLRSPERLHRAVRRHLGTTPDRYRQHFARS
ncbi:GlxA family transcriptional regulator [Dermatobacter hominis]|uniref:GlxA family transcriptional regulator n=1 Tax=Dermatobacter hominis TaxID=2884263 RepID=UPI001D112C45|nr:helix-turn-helix domain-containing protein [Dermatobacter hominis]UDY35999.1 helix-turn-helix domain-containing protein [Dermatobacter hominis]